MTPFAFDTLDASRRLREAGMDQGVAEAVVSVFQHAADVSDLATKEGVKRDLDFAKVELRGEIIASEARLRETIRLQGWAMMGGTATIVAIATAIIKLA